MSGGKLRSPINTACRHRQARGDNNGKNISKFVSDTGQTVITGARRCGSIDRQRPGMV
ncbi:hypothetical protein AGR7A_Lc50169 [Agrobacterium deltaense NCPPB 1641]|uniref:Uncharacterized protein n=1 Tax=Agrobacterium deltaense NCPPB 1641 TaxID=1183425 RepID=A0A1S7U6B9_9HYPH|nr:hypothetical protein AGR7A_Lc50169 [Agrobacterium deltaense NCPPB 1641]